MYTIRRQEIERENYSNFLASEEMTSVHLTSWCGKLKVDITRDQSIVKAVARYVSREENTFLAGLIMRQLPSDPQELLDRIYKKLLSIGSDSSLIFQPTLRPVDHFDKIQVSYDLQEGQHKYRRFLNSKDEQTLITLRDFHTGGIGIRRRDEYSFDIFCTNKYSEGVLDSVRVRSLPDALLQLLTLFNAVLNANKEYKKALYDMIGG